jgi:crotonobetainyl-CoA:carnitine CoA-transferase CaiB-like acyl-CoA transferase
MLAMTDNQAESHQPFAGLVVLDFTQVIAGPLAAQLLANSGAAVIKVESFSGDQLRSMLRTEKQPRGEDSPAFSAINRSKRSIAIDLKSEKGLQAILRIAAQCDVVIENFRPGVAERLGIGYKAIQAVRKDIIYCSISGFGQSGPLSPLPAYDGGIQAASGMMSTTGHPETGPVRTGFLCVDIPTALHSAYAISTALLRRERTGQGQRIDVSMLDTALLMQVSAVTKQLHDGTPSGLGGNASPAKSPLANTFQTADGYLTVSAVTEVHIKAILNALALPSEYYREYMDNETDSATNRNIVHEISEAFQRQGTALWVSTLKEAKVSVQPVNAVEDAIDIASTQKRPIVQQATGASLGATFSTNADGPIADGIAPSIGQQTGEVLSEFGFGESEIADLYACHTIR